MTVGARSQRSPGGRRHRTPRRPRIWRTATTRPTAGACGGTVHLESRSLYWRPLIVVDEPEPPGRRARVAAAAAAEDQAHRRADPAEQDEAAGERAGREHGRRGQLRADVGRVLQLG